LYQLSKAAAGEMSLLGPRSQFVDAYDTEDCRVLHLVPGMIHADWIVIPSEPGLLEKAEYAERYYLGEMRALASPQLRTWRFCG
jgi:lipopolysaccharide/colanic/teichoic acid biosynthesis glycosyltransferase